METIVRRVSRSDPTCVARGVVLVLEVHSSLEALNVVLLFVVTLGVDTSEDFSHSVGIAKSIPLSAGGERSDELFECPCALSCRACHLAPRNLIVSLDGPL